jgi:hypothetical protein
MPDFERDPVKEDIHLTASDSVEAPAAVPAVVSASDSECPTSSNRLSSTSSYEPPPVPWWHTVPKMFWISLLPIFVFPLLFLADPTSRMYFDARHTEDPEQALRLYDKALAIRRDKEVVLERAETAFENSLLDEAERSYSELVDGGIKRSDPYYYLAVVRANKHAPMSDVLALLRKGATIASRHASMIDVLTPSSDEPDMLIRCTYSLMLCGDSEAAFKLADSYGGPMRDMDVVKAFALRSLGRPGDAERLVKDLSYSRVRILDSELYLLRGLLALDRNDFTAAEKNLKWLERYDYNNALFPEYFSAAIAFQRGNYDAALKATDKILSYEPPEPGRSRRRILCGKSSSRPKA